MELRVDSERAGRVETGVYVRAIRDSKWVNADIAELDADSLLSWLRSRGGNNPWAENCVGILLGHGALHKVD